MGTTKSPGPRFKWARGKNQKIFPWEKTIQVLQYEQIRGELSNWSQPFVKAWRHMISWFVEERIANFV